jgi:hypothetical protein
VRWPEPLRRCERHGSNLSAIRGSRQVADSGENRDNATPEGRGERRVSCTDAITERHRRRFVGLALPNSPKTLIGKRARSTKPQQRAAARRSSWLPEPSERQAAVDRSSCSRLTSRRSPVRAGHRPSSGARFWRGTSAVPSNRTAWARVVLGSPGARTVTTSSRLVRVTTPAPRGTPRSRPPPNEGWRPWERHPKPHG